MAKNTSNRSNHRRVSLTSKQSAVEAANAFRQQKEAKRASAEALVQGTIAKLSSHLKKLAVQEELHGPAAPPKRTTHSSKPKKARVVVNRSNEEREYATNAPSHEVDSRSRPQKAYSDGKSERETGGEQLQYQLNDHTVATKKKRGQAGPPGPPGLGRAPFHAKFDASEVSKDVRAAASDWCEWRGMPRKFDHVVQLLRIFYSDFLRARRELITKYVPKAFKLTRADVQNAVDTVQNSYLDDDLDITLGAFVDQVVDVLKGAGPRASLNVSATSACKFLNREKLLRSTGHGVEADEVAKIAYINDVVNATTATAYGDEVFFHDIVPRLMQGPLPATSYVYNRDAELNDKLVEAYAARNRLEKVAKVHAYIMSNGLETSATFDLNKHIETLWNQARVHLYIRACQQERCTIYQLRTSDAVLKNTNLPTRALYKVAWNELTANGIVDLELDMNEPHLLKPTQVSQNEMQAGPLNDYFARIKFTSDDREVMANFIKAGLKYDLFMAAARENNGMALDMYEDTLRRIDNMYDRMEAFGTQGYYDNPGGKSTTTWYDDIEVDGDAAFIKSSHGEETEGDDLPVIGDWVIEKPAKSAAPWYDPSLPGYMVMQRNQLADAYRLHTIPSGCFYVDMQYVWSVSQVPPGVSPEPITALMVSQISDVPTYETYFINGGIVGGAKGKKAKMSAAQAANVVKKAVRSAVNKKKLHGKGAYGAPAVSYAGIGSFGSFTKGLSRALKPMIREGTKAAAREGVRSLMGAGDYVMPGAFGGETTVTNALMNNTRPYYRARTSNSEDESLTVEFYEYVADVYNNTAVPLTVTSIPFQPALPMGPLRRTCQLACNYENYEIDQLVFLYKSDVMSTQGSVGEVGLLFDHNAGDPTQWNSRFAIMEYHGAKMCNTNQNLEMGVECDPRKHLKSKVYYTRTNGVTGQDIKTYDFGTLNLITYNIPAAVVPDGGLCGRVYAVGRLRFGQPKLGAVLGNLNIVDQMAGTTGLTATNFAGTTQVLASFNNAGGTFATRTYTFSNVANGTFLIVLQFAGTGFTGAPGGATVAGNVAFTNQEVNGATAIVTATATAVTITATVRVVPALTNNANSISFTTGSFAVTTFTQSLLRVQQINPNAR